MKNQSIVFVDVNGAGFGTVHVDGVHVSCVRSVSTSVTANEAPIVNLGLAIPESLTVRYEGADLVVNDIVMPESVEIAIWRYLSTKYGKREIDATTLSSVARERFLRYR